MPRRVMIKPRPNPLTVDEAAQRIADMDNDEFEEEDDAEDGEESTEETLSPEEKADIEVSKSDDDIFDFCEKNYIMRGIPVSYIVKKNGSLVAELHPPCSWATIQEQHGGGLYQVKARNGHNRKYIRFQSQHILEPVKKYSEEKPVEKTVEKIIEKQAAESGINVLDVLNMYRENQKEAAEAIRIAQKEAQIAQQNMMTAILQMAQTKNAPASSDDKILALMMQMQQNTNQTFEKMMTMNQQAIAEVTRNSEKMFDKLATKIESASSEKAVAGMTYSPQQVMEMMQQAQTRGFEMWTHTERMAEAKAEQKIRILEATKETAIEDSRPKSLTEKLVDSMLPGIAAALAGSMAGGGMGEMPMMQAPQPQPQPQPRPQPRALPPAQPQAQARPQPQVQGRPKAPVANRVTPKPQPQVIDVPKRDPFGFPTAKKPQTQQNQESEETVFKFQRYLKSAADVLTPKYVEFAQGKKPITEVANELIESLKAQGIGTKEFISVCPLNKIRSTLSTLGADEGIINFVGEVYADLEARTAMGLGG